MRRKIMAVLIKMVLGLAEMMMSGFGRTAVLPMTSFTAVHTAVFMAVFVLLLLGEFLELGVIRQEVGKVNVGGIRVIVSSGMDIGAMARVCK
jgi:hypothetical protein